MPEGDWAQIVLKALIAVAALAGAIAAIFRWLGSRARTSIEGTRLEVDEKRRTTIEINDTGGSVNVVNESYNRKP